VRSLRLFPKKFWFKPEGKMGKDLRVTFDRVGLDELCTVHKQRVGNGFPRGYRLWQADVHVCGGKFINVKPNVLWPRIFNQIFI
jgi:hypothetical protein